MSKFNEGIFNTKLENWLKFVDNRSMNGVTDDKILKAIEELKILRGDNYIRQMYETEIKIKLVNDLNRAENIEKGKIEGLEEGEKKGLKKGIKKGKMEGLKEGKIEIAKNMLKLNVDVNIISQSTGLSIEEIKNLL